MAQGTLESLKAAIGGEMVADTEGGQQLSGTGMGTWTGPSGTLYNIVAGKAYNFAPGQAGVTPPEDAAVLQQGGVPTTSAQDVANVMDPNGPGNGEGGSDWSNILMGITFVVGGAAGLGAFGADSALIKAATTAINLANGGSPMSAIISYAAPAFTGGGEGLDISGGLDGPAGDGLLNTVGTGDPYKFASADTGTMSDASPDTGSNVATPSAENYAEAYPGSGTGTGGLNMNNADSVAAKAGLLDGAMPEWFKNLDPKVQQAMLVAGGGLVSGALSGVGTYAATKAKIEADKVLADRVSQNRTNEATAIRNANQAGILNMAPSTAGLVLRRSNGTPYYS